MEKKVLENGEYCHIGLETGLFNELVHKKNIFTNELDLSFNVD